MTNKKNSLIIQKRLNDLMFEHKLNYTKIGKKTKTSRQTVTSYFTGKTEAPLSFVRDYYTYINSLNPKHNLNFEYLVNPYCEIKSITTKKDLEITGLNQQSIDNLYNIVRYSRTEPTNLLQEELEVFPKNELNYRKLYILNSILSSHSLMNLVDKIDKTLQIYNNEFEYIDDMNNEINNIRNKINENRISVDFYNDISNNIQSLELNIERLESFKNKEITNKIDFLKWYIENEIKAMADETLKNLIELLK